MPFHIDGALYPDRIPPAELGSIEERIDYLARLCAAWDFGRLPDAETVAEIRKAEWRNAVEETRLLTSPAYHLLRSWHRLPQEEYLGQELAYIRDDPNLGHV